MRCILKWKFCNLLKYFCGSSWETEKKVFSPNARKLPRTYFIFQIATSDIFFGYLSLFCCIFRPAFGCWALETLVEIVILSVFFCKKAKKTRHLQQIFAKNMVHPKNKGFTPNNPKMNQSYSGLQLFIGKNVFFEKKLISLGIKQSTSVLVQT